MENTIIFIDELFNFKKITSFQENSIIISLDIASHYNLEHLGIEHKKIEDYLNKTEIKKIDEFCFDLAFKKMNSSFIYELFEYDGFHMAHLFGFELLSLMLKTIKLNVGISNILKKSSFKKIICTKFINSIINNLDNNQTYSFIIVSENQQISLDRVLFPITLGKKTFHVSIPLKLAIKGVKFIQKLYRFFFKIKFNMKNDFKKNFTLITDLSLSSYPDLFKNLGKKENILLIDEFAPPIWNKENMTIAKFSNLKIIKLKDFANKKLDKKVSYEIERIMSIIKKLEENKSFVELFRFDEIAIWPIIQENFEKMCYTIFKESIEKNELLKKLFLKIKLNEIIVLYSRFPITQMLIHNAHKNNIPCLKIRHGLHPLTPLYTKVVQADIIQNQPNLKFTSWNKDDLNYSKKSGVKNDHLILTGEPQYDRLFNQKIHSSDSEHFILICTSFLQFKWSLSGYDTNNSIKNRDAIIKICKISNQIKDKKTVVKIHPSVKANFDLPLELLNNDINIPIFKTQNIVELIKKSDVIVSVDYSTLLLESMILGKPTITYMTDSEWYESDEIIQSQYTIPVRTPEEFENALNLIVYDDDFRKNLISKAKSFVDSQLINQGNASNVLINYLKSKKHH